MPDAALAPLLLAAATVGLVHTLAGPDHYVPLIALGKQRGLGLARTLRLTLVAGLLHCVTSVLLVLALLAALTTAGSIELVQAWRGSAAGMLLLGLGVAMLVCGLRARRAAARRTPARRTPARRTPAARGRTSWPLLAAVFALGPCEWLVPAATTAAAHHGLTGALAVSAVFTAATLLAMTAAVTLGLASTARLKLRLDPMLAGGAATALCGAMVLAGF